MSKQKIHLIASAGVCRPFLNALGLETASGLIELTQYYVGNGYQVTCNLQLIDAGEDEQHGGRNDDRERAADIESALADDGVAAIVSIRGGAWFTRVLPHIDFGVLRRRTKPVAVFGFSELTTLVNIVAHSNHGIGIYDMGPAFLRYGIKRWAMLQEHQDETRAARVHELLTEHFKPELQAFFADVIRIISGQGTARIIEAKLVHSEGPTSNTATFVGGNLTVMSALVGSSYHDCIDPAGKWLVLEDFNDKLERIDRFLAHLTIARMWDRIEGLLLGDFHKGYEDLRPAVIELLAYHLPSKRRFPLLTANRIGHVWPMSPLPLHIQLNLKRLDESTFAIEIPSASVSTVA